MTELSDQIHLESSRRRAGPRKSLTDWYTCNAPASEDGQSEPNTPKSPTKRCRLLPTSDFFIGHESESEDDRIPAGMREAIRALCAEYFEAHASDLKSSLLKQCAASFRDEMSRSMRSLSEEIVTAHTRSFWETQSKLSDEVQALQEALDKLKEPDQAQDSVDAPARAEKNSTQNSGCEECLGLDAPQHILRKASLESHQTTSAGTCPAHSQELHQQIRELRQEMRLIGKQITWRMLGSAEAERSEAGSVAGSLCGSVAGSIASAAAANSNFSRGTRDVRERLLARRQRKCEQFDASHRASQH